MNKFYKMILFLLPLLFFVPNINIYAEDLDQEETNSNTLGSMFNFDYAALSFSGWQNSVFNTGSFNTNYLPQMSGSASNYPLNIDTSDFSISPKQFIFVNRSGWSLGIGGYLVLVDNVNVVAVTGNQCFGLASTDGSEFNIEIILYNNDGSISTAEDPIQDSSSGGIYTFTASRRIDIMTSSMFIYGSKYNYNISDAVTNIVLADDPTLNGFQMNYLLFDENGDLAYNNPFSSGGVSGENTSNNLYMQNPNWQFRNIPSFGSLLDTNSKGQAIFSGQLTDYQKQNLDKFRLDFTFNTFWNGSTFSIGSDDVTQVRHDFSKSFLYQIQVPLSDFYSGGSLYSFYIDDIFANSISNDTDQTLADWSDYYIHEYNHNTITFRTAFTVNLIALDNSGESGSCTAYYSYKTGTSQTTNNSMGINTNPYVDDDGNASGVTDPTQDPSGDGSGSGVGNVGDGSIVNNNNPVININNNNSFSDGDSDGLISKILLLIANNQSATSSGIEEIADTSGFVDLMGATWLAVPTTWWTTLTAAFIASIGILVVGFIIKIIIGLIF